nr:DUF4178 domain-containing protein [Nocardioides daedukensis]
MIGIVVLAAVAALVVWFVRRRSKPADGPFQPDDVVGTADLVSTDALRTLQNGDVIEYLGHKWFVRGRLDFNEDGYVWTEHLLDDAEEKRWVSVEDDEGFEVSLWHSIPLGDIDQGTAGDRDVIVAGTAYRLQERGTARFSALGSTGTAPSGQIDYADYRSNDGKLLGFEKFGSSWEASVGEMLQPFELTVFPGSDRTE